MTNAAATTPAVTEKPKSKMELARPLYKEIYTEGYQLKAEGAKSQRGEFVKRAMAEIGLTKHGAATYFQNLSNESRGMPTYKHSKKTGSKASTTVADATGQLTQTTEEAADANSKVATEGEIGKYRWLVTNAAGEELSSWPTRSKAQAEAKAIEGEWTDRNAKAE